MLEYNYPPQFIKTDFAEVSQFFDDEFSKYGVGKNVIECDFRRSLNIQECFLAIIEKRKKSVDVDTFSVFCF